MALNGPNDKELERLFQGGAERYETDFDPEAWSQMEMLLNKKKRRGLFYLLMPFIGLLFAFFFLFLKPDLDKVSSPADRSPAADSESSIHTKLESFDQKEDVKTSLNNMKNSIDKGSDGLKASEENINELEAKKTVINQSSATSKQTSSIGKATNFNKEQIKDSDDYSSARMIQNEIDNPTQDIGALKVPTASDPLSNNESYDANGVFHLQTLLIRPLALTGMNRIQRKPLPPVIEVKRDFTTFWNLGLTLGMDASRTKSNGLSSAQLLYGLAMKYNFSSKFAISFSTAYTKDSYIAGRYDYKPPKGYWKNRPDTSTNFR